jgi:nucleotide-binding universal stress UspA family protein
MKHILVPTDFSKNAEKALQTGLQLAKQAGIKLVVFNAYELPYSQNVMTTSLMDIMKEMSEKGIAEVKKKLTGQGVDFAAISRYGSPVRVVAELEAEFPDSLIVMGTKGASGIEEVLIGSNAASIMHHAQSPVLAIPAASEFHMGKNILYSCDMRTQVPESLKELRAFSLMAGMPVHVLHVDDDHPVDLSAAQVSIRKVLSDSVEFHTVPGDVIDAEVLDFATKGHYGMIAFMPRHYNFLSSLFHRSVSSRIAYHSKIPFLSIPEKL